MSLNSLCPSQNLIHEIVEIKFCMAGFLTCSPLRIVFPAIEMASDTIIGIRMVAMELTVAGLFRLFT